MHRLIMATKNDTYLEHSGGGRTVSTACEGIINGMQPGALSTPAPDVQTRIDDARKVLYVPDDDGDIVIKSKLFKAYEKNTKAYGQAVADTPPRRRHPPTAPRPRSGRSRPSRCARPSMPPGTR